MPAWMNRVISAKPTVTEDLAPPNRDLSLCSIEDMKKAVLAVLVEDYEVLYNMITANRPHFPCEADDVDDLGAIESAEWVEFDVISEWRGDEDGYWTHRIEFLVNLTFANACLRWDNCGPDFMVEKASLYVRNVKSPKGGLFDSYDYPEIFWSDEA